MIILQSCSRSSSGCQREVSPVLQYQGIEWDFYLLKAGDSVLVSYNGMLRPRLISKTYDENAKRYNLPF